MAEQVPVLPTSSQAEEGTFAHALAEHCLLTGAQADTVEYIDGERVPEDMAEHVQVFLDYCRQYTAAGWVWWVEKKFSLAKLSPPEPMFGSADFVAYNTIHHILVVADLKYGRGVVVEVEGNLQLPYYGLGAALELEQPITDVVLAIVQPRAPHADGPVREIKMSYLELIEYGAALLAAARRTLDPNAPLNPGSHCRWCPASGVCPAQREQAFALAQIEFKPEAPHKIFLPAPETVPIEQVVEWLPHFDTVEAFIKACRGHVQARLEAGIEVPGWKLVAKRATRKWADEGATKQVLQGPDYYESSLKSVAQVEKVMGKKAFAATMEDHVIKQSSGHKMVPVAAPGEAIVITRGEEFLALPSGEE